MLTSGKGGSWARRWMTSLCPGSRDEEALFEQSSGYERLFETHISGRTHVKCVLAAELAMLTGLFEGLDSRADMIPTLRESMRTELTNRMRRVYDQQQNLQQSLDQFAVMRDIVCNHNTRVRQSRDAAVNADAVVSFTEFAEAHGDIADAGMDRLRAVQDRMLKLDADNRAKAAQEASMRADARRHAVGARDVSAMTAAGSAALGLRALGLPGIDASSAPAAVDFSVILAAGRQNSIAQSVTAATPSVNKVSASLLSAAPSAPARKMLMA